MFKHRFGIPKRRTSPPPVRTVFFISLILFLILVFISIWIIDKQIRPPLMAIAEERTVDFATRTINAAVKSTERMNFEDLLIVDMDNNGNVSTLGWNSAVVNDALRTATERAEYFLYSMNHMEELDPEDPDIERMEFEDSLEDLPARDPTVTEIPIGQATGIAILSNLGPKIPVHFEIVGSLETDVVHELKEFGVNAALVEIYIPVTVHIQIVIPFSTGVTTVSTRVFIDSRVIMGDVPEFYSGSGDGPSISVPKSRFNNE